MFTITFSFLSELYKFLNAVREFWIWGNQASFLILLEIKIEIFAHMHKRCKSLVCTAFCRTSMAVFRILSIAPLGIKTAVVFRAAAGTL